MKTKTEIKPSPLVEIARSFSFKLNLGGYQMADFFCSHKEEVPKEEAEKASEESYKFCKKEVLKSVNEYVKEKTPKPEIKINESRNYEERAKGVEKLCDDLKEKELKPF